MKKYFIIIVALTSCILARSGTIDERRIQLRDSILSLIHEPSESSNSIAITQLETRAVLELDCKPAFDKAMKLAQKKKGLKLIFPAGNYLFKGPMHLVSNLTIEVQKGATIRFSSDVRYYLPEVLSSWEGTMLYNYSPFIYGNQLQNIRITGEGVIDGNASDTFQKWKSLQTNDQQLSREMNRNKTAIQNRHFGEGHYLRPQLIQLLDCKNILIQGIKITNSPFWCIHLLKSENITLRGIKYDAKNINNDGIDPEYSRNILIEDIQFDNGDDNIAIKSGRDTEGRDMARPSENICIRNCTFKGLHAFVAGSEMSSGVQNIVIENCKASGYCKRGIYLKSNPDRGGFIRNIYVDNLQFDNVEDLFYITTFYHGEGKGYVSDIHDIYVNNIRCREASNAALVIQGFETRKVKNIYIDHFDVGKAKVAMSINQAENVVLGSVNIGGKIMEIPSAEH